jgi:hypothetical protein
MNRRDYLRKSVHTTSGVLAITVSSDDMVEESVDADGDLCGIKRAMEGSDGAFRPPSSDPSFIIPADGRPDVRIHWRDPEWFGTRGAGFAVGLGNIGGEDIALNFSYANSRNDWLHILMHELAHSLGYTHQDSGIASYGYGGAEDFSSDQPLADSTRDVAKTFDGFRYMDWTIKDLSRLAGEYSKSKLGIGQLCHGALRYAGDSKITGCYFEDEFEQFGGVIENRVSESCFYGWPTLSRTPKSGTPES